jgi:hypothetical protein
MEESGQQTILDDGVSRLIQEETEKVIRHICAALPRELAEILSQSGELKETLLGYFERNVHAMVGDYAPRDIADLPESTGGASSAEVEKSIVNMYGHLRGHIQRGINELENQTNSLLRQNTDSGAFIRGDKAYMVVKSSFRDNPERPKTVTDLNLCINILESELLSPIFHYQVTVEYLIKDLLSKNIIDTIDRAVAALRDERLDEGLEELTDTEIIINKLGKVEEFTDDNAEDAAAKRYSLLTKELLDRLKDTAEIDPQEFDQLNIRENLKKIVDNEHIRDRGFNTAVNSLCTILDNSRLGFQFIENFKNARELQIREYDDTDPAVLPDEHYRILMRYCDGAQLREECTAYDVQMQSFETEILRAGEILRVLYEDSKSPFKVSDFKDLILKTKERTRTRNKGKKEGPLYADMDKPWDGISFVKPGETEVEKMNRTYAYEKGRIRTRIKVMRETIRGIYGNDKYPPERHSELRSLEDRLNFLEKEYTRFDYRINPYHLHPGLVLEVDVTSIKRKRITLNAMSKALNEFLQSVSRGFQGTVFSPGEPPSRRVVPDGQSFGDLLNGLDLPGDTPPEEDEDREIREI